MRQHQCLQIPHQRSVPLLAGEGPLPPAEGPQPPPPAEHPRACPQATMGLERSAEGHEALKPWGGSVGGGDKGQEAGGCGVSPQPRPQPLQRRQAAASRYRVPPPNPSPGAAAFPRGAEMSSLPQAQLLLWHRDLSEVGGEGLAAGPPPHRTPIASQPKAARPAALNSAPETHPLFWEERAPKGTARHSPPGSARH